MALTPEDVKTLTGLFRYEDHEFNQGFVYITERAICDRLDAVDPGWHFDLKSLQVRDNHVVAVGSLTLSGVTREGVGMEKIMEKAGEAEKSAATDSLKRAARLFGVGRYLLDAPKEGQFKAWLAQQGGKWTREQANCLITEARALHVSDDELLALLDVQRISEYAPGLTAASEALKKYAAARPKTATAPVIDLFAGDAD